MMPDMLGARSVRRDELQSPQSSPRSSPDPDLQQLFQSRVSSEYTFDAPPQDQFDAKDGGQSDEEEIELRLFAAPANAPPQTQKIRISSPGRDLGEPGFLVKKPRSYYFAEDPTQSEQEAYLASAIDAKTILELSRQPWPACAVPWKVRTISAKGLKKEVLVGHPPALVAVEEAVHKRTRKNKKTRIAIRKKKEALKVKQEKQAKSAQEKEEADREKRTRRNREKKVKKKAREQAKKAANANGKTEAGADTTVDVDEPSEIAII